MPVVWPDTVPERVAKDFIWTQPVVAQEEMDIPPYPVMEITEEFGVRDVNHVSSADPKLFAGTDQIVIDLMRLQKGDYAFPLRGAKLISPYGGQRKGHVGADLKTRAGDTIRATFDGIVRMAKDYAAYGNVIVIRHFNGLETVYAHNSKHIARQGEHVKAGQPIALTGRTGRATTEHLHFEVRINGRPFDPSLLFDMERQDMQDNLLLCTKTKNGIDVSSMQRLPVLMHLTDNK